MDVKDVINAQRELEAYYEEEQGRAFVYGFIFGCFVGGLLTWLLVS